MTSEYLLDTNILIYYTQGLEITKNFVDNFTPQYSFNISILTKIEFLGWDKHTDDGFKKCKELIEHANIYQVDEAVSNKAIELKRRNKIKLADAIIAATALLNNLKLVTRNADDFKMLEGLEVVNVFAGN